MNDTPHDPDFDDLNGIDPADEADAEAGEAFDPHLHQAMMEQPSETVPGGSVIQTLQAGYALFGRTVRPAMVVVAAKGSGPAPGTSASDAAHAYEAAASATGGAHDSKA